MIHYDVKYQNLELKWNTTGECIKKANQLRMELYMMTYPMFPLP